jgi:hypothetical protein
VGGILNPSNTGSHLQESVEDMEEMKVFENLEQSFRMAPDVLFTDRHTDSFSKQKSC